MSDATENADPTLEEELVAYLDGELDADAARRIEERLAGDPKVRSVMQRLDRTWQLLGELDTAPVDEQFTRTTLEMARVAAEEELTVQRAEAPRRRRRHWLLASALVLLAAAGSFAAVAFSLPDPNRRVLDELPVLENLDQYAQAGDVEFLLLLYRERVFAEESEQPSPGPAPAGDESLAERRERIEAMPAAEKEQLLRRLERFESLAPAEQERLRKLDRDIQRDDHAAELREALRRYYAWFKALPDYRRDELLMLDARQRVDRIQRWRDEQTKTTANRLPRKDAEALFRWMEQYATKNESRVLSLLPEERRQYLAKGDPAARRRVVQWLMWQRWTFGGMGKLPMAADEDLAELRARFTPETLRRLEGLSTVEQWRTIANWVFQELRAQMSSRRPGTIAPIDEQHLADFFERELSDEERDQLLRLPADQMQRELRIKYLQKNKLVEPGWYPHDGRWHGGKPPPGGEGKGPRKPPGPWPPRTDKSGKPDGPKPDGLPPFPPPAKPSADAQ